MSAPFPDYSNYALATDPLAIPDASSGYWGSYSAMCYPPLPDFSPGYPPATVPSAGSSSSSATDVTKDQLNVPYSTSVTAPSTTSSTSPDSAAAAAQQQQQQQSLYASWPSFNYMTPNDVKTEASYASSVGLPYPPYADTTAPFYPSPPVPQVLSPSSDGLSIPPPLAGQLAPSFDYSAQPSGSSASSTTGPIRGGSKRKTRSDSDDDGFSDDKDVDRRTANNARERVRVRDINTAFKDLGKLCSTLNANADKTQTKLSILQSAVQTIIELEEKVRGKNMNVNPKVACLQRRKEDEKLQQHGTHPEQKLFTDQGYPQNTVGYS